MFMSFSWHPERRMRLRRAVVIGSALLVLGLESGMAAGPLVRPFSQLTWQEIVAHERPAVVVFSTTDCAYCPAAIETLAKDLRATHSQTKLLVVVMDGEGQEAALRKDRHYRRANGLYVFRDNPVALRYAVDPNWRGMTPYVALLAKLGDPTFVVGAPSHAVLNATFAIR